MENITARGGQTRIDCHFSAGHSPLFSIHRLQLGFQNRRGTERLSRRRKQKMFMATRQRARRQYDHQQQHIHPGQRKRLRPLGRSGQPRLVVQRRFTVFFEKRRRHHSGTETIAVPRCWWTNADKLFPVQIETGRDVSRVRAASRVERGGLQQPE